MFTLITAANTSSAYQLKSLLNSENILLGDYLEVPDFMVASGKILRLPDPQSASYTHQVLALCLDRNIDTIYALREQEIDLLFVSKQLFNEYGITILAADDKVQ